MLRHSASAEGQGNGSIRQSRDAHQEFVSPRYAPYARPPVSTNFVPSLPSLPSFAPHPPASHRNFYIPRPIQQHLPTYPNQAAYPPHPFGLTSISLQPEPTYSTRLVDPRALPAHLAYPAPADQSWLHPQPYPPHLVPYQVPSAHIAPFQPFPNHGHPNQLPHPFPLYQPGPSVNSSTFATPLDAYGPASFTSSPPFRAPRPSERPPRADAASSSPPPVIREINPPQASVHTKPEVLSRSKLTSPDGITFQLESEFVAWLTTKQQTQNWWLEDDRATEDIRKSRKAYRERKRTEKILETGVEPKRRNRPPVVTRTRRRRYLCDHAGHPEKSAGTSGRPSKKIGCPAAIMVDTECDGSISVDFRDVHVGHDPHLKNRIKAAKQKEEMENWLRRRIQDEAHHAMSSALPEESQMNDSITPARLLPVPSEEPLSLKPKLSASDI